MRGDMCSLSMGLAVEVARQRVQVRQLRRYRATNEVIAFDLQPVDVPPSAKTAWTGHRQDNDDVDNDDGDGRGKVTKTR